jgi:hypothetical protein
MSAISSMSAHASHRAKKRRGAGVRVLDRDGGEFEEAARAVVAGAATSAGAAADRPSATLATGRDLASIKSFDSPSGIMPISAT